MPSMLHADYPSHVSKRRRFSNMGRTDPGSAVGCNPFAGVAGRALMREIKHYTISNCGLAKRTQLGI